MLANEVKQLLDSIPMYEILQYVSVRESREARQPLYSGLNTYNPNYSQQDLESDMRYLRTHIK